jgi:hypothetical protein
MSSTEQFSSPEQNQQPIGSTSSAAPDFAAILNKAKKIVSDPIGAWSEIKNENSSIESIYKDYVIFLAAIPAIAGFLNGLLFHGRLFGNLFSHLFFYGLQLGGLYLLAMLIEWLAPKFDGGGSRAEAFKLAAYSLTPIYLAGALDIVWFLGALATLVAAIYSIYVFYLGITPLVRVSENKRVVFILAMIGCGLIIMFPLSLFLGILGLALF